MNIPKTQLAMALLALFDDRKINHQEVQAKDLEAEYQLIQKKQSKLPANKRKALVEFYEFLIKKEGTENDKTKNSI